MTTPNDAPPPQKPEDDPSRAAPDDAPRQPGPWDRPAEGGSDQDRHGEEAAGAEADERRTQILQDPTAPAGRMSFRGAPVTVLIITVAVAIELALQVEPEMRNQLVTQFAFIPVYTVAVFQGGAPLEYLLQTVSYTMLHGFFLHVAFNMAAFAAFGPPSERTAGSLRYVLLFAVCGIAGALFHLLWILALAGFDLGAAGRELYTPLVGASGAVFGVLGFDLGRRALALARVPAALRLVSPAKWLWKASFGVIVLNVVIMFAAPFISGAAHLGGFVAGLALAPLLLRGRPLLDDLGRRP